jgi:hypothetical protein
VGYYQDGQNDDGFVATPTGVPEPSTFVIVGIVLLSLAVYSCCRRARSIERGFAVTDLAS